MRIQTTAVLLTILSQMSVVLLSSDVQQHHQHVKHHQHQGRHHAEPLHQIKNRIVIPFPPPRGCYWLCQNQLYFNLTTNITAYTNVTANVSLVIDVNAQIVAALDGNTGAAIVVDIAKQVGVYITAKQSSSLTWRSADESISVYLKQLTTLKILLDAENCHHFNLTTVTTEEQELIIKVLINLSADLKLTTSNALQILIQISQSLIKLFTNNVIYGIFKQYFSNNETLIFNGGLTALINILTAIENLIGSINTAGDKFNLGIINNSVGFQILIELLIQIGENVNLNTTLGSQLNTAEALFKLLAEFSLSKNSGIDGISYVVYNLILYLNGKIQTQAFFQILVEFAINAKGKINYVSEFSEFEIIIRSQQKRYGNSSLVGLNTTITEVLQGKLFIKGANISKVIEDLSSGNQAGALELIIRVLFDIATGVKVGTTLPEFVFYLITSLNSTIGINIVVELIPGINIPSLDVTILWRYIFKGITISNILSGNLWKFLYGLPVIGSIVKAVSAALTVVSSGSFSLELLIIGNGSVVEEIRVFLKWVLQVVVGGLLPTLLPPIVLPPIFPG